MTEAGESEIGGVPYVEFSAEALGERELAFLANLSSAYALFAVEGELLRPVPLQPLARLDDDLLTIQRYAGKTNEQFTKLLLNLTITASGFARDMLDRKLAVFDPVCGRGTTLNQALSYGFDAAGMDVDARDFDAYAHFIRRWLEDKRLKHRAGVTPVRREGKLVARRLDVTLAPTKEAHRAGETLELRVVNADTTRAREFFRAGAFDLIVGDLPYGIQHGSRTRERGLSRSPVELLGAALSGWIEVLRPAGAIGLAWNTKVAPRKDAEAVLIGAGLELVDRGEFRHRVDQAIERDVLLARKL